MPGQLGTLTQNLSPYVSFTFVAPAGRPELVQLYCAAILGLLNGGWWVDGNGDVGMRGCLHRNWELPGAAACNMHNTHQRWRVHVQIAIEVADKCHGC